MKMRAYKCHVVAALCCSRVRHEVENKGEKKEWGSEGGKDWDWDT